MKALQSALGDPLGIQIDVADLEAKWRSDAYGMPYTCAACGRRLEDQVDVPLVLWRREGAEILTLHWECAQLRMISLGQRN